MQSTARKLAALLLVALWLVCPAQAQEAEWERLSQESATLNQQGRHAQAITIAQQALKIADETFGADHPNVDTSLNDLASLYVHQGEYVQAEPIYKRSLAIREKALGLDHLFVANSLHMLAVLYYVTDDYAQAEPLFKRSLAIREKTLGLDHPEVATTLNDLAMLYQAQSNYAKAEPLYKRSLSINEKALGPDHPEVATNLNNLATLYHALGQYDAAEQCLSRSLAIREKALGPNHPEVASTLRALGSLYSSQGHYPQAEPLLKRSLAIREKALGPDDPRLASTLLELGNLYRAQSQYAQAEPLYKRSLAIREKALGPDHSEVATNLNNLALVYEGLRQYAQVEPLYKRSLAIQERVLGPDHPYVAATLNNLASYYYQVRGDYAKADPLYKRSLAIVEKVLGPDHLNVAHSLNNLAALYETLGKVVAAEQLYKRSLAIQEKALGPDHPDVAMSLHNLAYLYLNHRQFALAEPLYKRSLAIWEKVLGPDHSRVADTLSDMEVLYSHQGQPAQAVLFGERALVIREKVLGPDHPDVTLSLNNLGLLYQTLGQNAAAEKLHKRSIAIWERAGGSDNLGVALSLSHLVGLYSTQGKYTEALSLARRVSAIKRKRILVRGTGDTVIEKTSSNRFGFSQHLSLLSKNFDNEPADKITDEAFQIVQLNQVSGTASDIAKMAARAAARDDTLAKKVREYQDAITAWRQLDKQFIEAMGKNVSQRNPDREKMLRKSLVDTEERIKQTGTELRRDFPAYQELVNPEPMDVAKTQSLLKPDEALVTYLVNSEELLIWIIRPDQARMVRVDVTRAALSKRIATLRRRVDLSQGVLPYFSTTEAHALYETVFAPVAQYLDGVKHVMVVADGPLQSLPFGLLVTRSVEAKSKAPVPWLIRQYAFSNLPSVSSLRALRLFERGASAPEPFIAFGDPLLEGKPGLARNISIGKIFARGAVADVSEVRRLPRLPETASELKAMAKAMGSTGANVWLRDAATEQRAKTVDLSRFRVVAFATHGLISGEFPGLAQPALVLTPPDTPSEFDDGLLTASEITGLKLNADWVILSACNTASANGEPGAEGFSGLAKAFFYAGTKALLVSHWAVDSKSTATLTSRLFAETKGGASPAEALRSAMISLADNPRTSHPAFWAPFVVVGEGWKAEAK